MALERSPESSLPFKTLYDQSGCKAEMIFKLYCALLSHPSKTPLFSISDGKVAAIKKCAAARLLIQLATNVTTVKTGKGQKQNNPKIEVVKNTLYIRDLKASLNLDKRKLRLNFQKFDLIFANQVSFE